MYFSSFSPPFFAAPDFDQAALPIKPEGVFAADVDKLS